MTTIKSKIALLITALILLSHALTGQSSTETASLRAAGKYGTRYTDRTVKIPNVVLEGVRPTRNFLPYVLQLHDRRANFRRGENKKGDEACCIRADQDFVIFADSEIGSRLLDEKLAWFNSKVNIYIRITDIGFPPTRFQGRVVKVERLNNKGRVDKVVQ